MTSDHRRKAGSTGNEDGLDVFNLDEDTDAGFVTVGLDPGPASDRKAPRKYVRKPARKPP